ncbi:MAG: hypothetical protein R2848_18620 [Thermomicrobiales bacterium]
MAEEQKDETVEVVETVTDVVEAPADAYSKEELVTLTKALGAVVLGAGMSEKSGAFGLMREIMAAMRASAIFVGDSSNPLLKQIVTDTDPSDIDQAESEAKSTPESAQKAVEDGIAAAKSSHELILAKGNAEDADAWAQLLLTAANAAVKATKTGGFLGFGGEKITTSEAEYMQQLADTLGYKKETA